MKLICVDYPFSETPRRYYPTLTLAKKDALDRYLVQEEVEDEEEATEASVCPSRGKASVYEVNVPLKKSVLSNCFNNEPFAFYNDQTLISEFRYRRGKIVVSKAKVATEPQG